MPYGTGSYGSLPYGGDFDHAASPAGSTPRANAWWWVGTGARTIADAGFLLLVAPHFDDGADPPLEGAE